MPNETGPHEIRELWQTHEEEKVTIPMEEIQRRAARFERRIRNRNLREYAGGAAVIAVFALEVWCRPGWQSAPAWLLIAGTVYALFQLHRRGSVGPVVDSGIPATL